MRARRARIYPNNIYIMGKTESYTTHDYDAINKQIDEELSYHQGLTRLTQGRSQRRYFHNYAYLIVAIAIVCLILSVAFWVYRHGLSIMPVASSNVPVISENNGAIEVRPRGGTGTSSDAEKQIIENSIIIEKRVPVPVEIEVEGESVTNFTIFTEKATTLDGIDKVVTGASFYSSNDELPYTQWCYTTNSRNNVSSTQVKLASKEARDKVSWHDISSDDAKQYGATIENLNAAKDFCSFIYQSAPSISPNITPEDQNKLASSGTAFYVGDKGHLVTNEHVIGKCSTVWINQNDKQIAVEVIAKDAKSDLAIIKSIRNEKHIGLKFSKKVFSGQDVIAFGYPLGDALGEELKVTKGNVSAMSGIKGNPLHLQFTAPIQSGNSGGPLLDSSGLVIGMNTATLRGEQFQNINFAIKGGVIQEYLGSNGISFFSNEATEKDTSVVVDIATQSTVQVQCY